MVILVSLLVCLIPTTIGALVSAIGVAGMDRLVQHNVLAMSGRAVEAAGDVSTLLLDKTGTITYGNRQASRLIAAPGIDPDILASAALAASLADDTPAWACDGAPSDCVALPLMGFIEEKIDVVVSGINPNANIGDDVTYSGTVTAAMEAVITGKIPGIAVSLVDRGNNSEI